MGVIPEKIAISLGVTAAAGLILGGVVLSTTNINRADNDQTQAQQTAPERTITETKKESISYETKTVEDGSIEYGQTVVRAEGSYGEKTYTYNVTYEGDKEISRELVKEEITKQPVAKVIAKGTKIVWHCVDATSYNKNPYDDNKCTSSTGEIRYVSDSQSRALDPSYSPGQSGHYYYNSK
ncbi:G5 domain-containing protein [Candidatus Saccharibacteria bacterium]|nr:G5 domain-containing protein [Candidatus Saccharibacteria bacterium]